MNEHYINGFTDAYWGLGFNNSYSNNITEQLEYGKGYERALEAVQRENDYTRLVG